MASSLVAAALLAVSHWPAGPATAVTCPAGYVPVMFNGIESCSPAGTGAVAGDGSVGTGGGGITVPGQVTPVNGGGMGPAPLPQYVPAPAPYVPAVPAPAPAAPAPAVVPAAPVQGGYVAPPTSQQEVMAQGGSGSVAPAAGEQTVPEAPIEVAAVEAPPETRRAAGNAEAQGSAAAPASPEVVAGAPESAEAIKGVQTSDAGTTFAGFIAGAFGVLVIAAGVLYWRKGRTRGTTKGTRAHGRTSD